MKRSKTGALLDAKPEALVEQELEAAIARETAPPWERHPVPIDPRDVGRLRSAATQRAQSVAPPRTNGAPAKKVEQVMAATKRTCEQCGVAITGAKTKRFCSARCNRQAWEQNRRPHKAGAAKPPEVQVLARVDLRAAAASARTVVVPIRLTPEEFQAVALRAAEQDATIADLLRKVLGV